MTFNGYGTVVVGDDGLDNGQAEAGAVLLGRVVGRKQALALFRSKAFARVGNFDFYFVLFRSCRELENAAVWHGVPGVRREVQEDLLDLAGLGGDGPEPGGQAQAELGARAGCAPQ